VKQATSTNKTQQRNEGRRVSQLASAVIWEKCTTATPIFSAAQRAMQDFFRPLVKLLTWRTSFLQGRLSCSAGNMLTVSHKYDCGTGKARSIGWQLAATKDSTAGPDLPPDSFGHTGLQVRVAGWIPDKSEFSYYSQTAHMLGRFRSQMQCAPVCATPSFARGSKVYRHGSNGNARL